MQQSHHLIFNIIIPAYSSKNIVLRFIKKFKIHSKCLSITDIPGFV